MRAAGGGLAPGTLSAYLGHFMATNGASSPDRANAHTRRPGTLTEDSPAGIVDFAAWAGTPPPVTLTAYGWGEALGSTASLRNEDPKVPEDEWDEKGGIGHAVTGVGFVKDRERLRVIVHNTWSTTPEDVAVPWDHVFARVRLGPR